MYGPLQPPSELLYVIVGALAATGGSFLLRWYQQRTKRDRLKKALATEIKAADVDTIRDFATDKYEGHPEAIDPDDIADLTEEQAEMHIENYWRGLVAGRFDRVSLSCTQKDVYIENLNDVGLLSESQIEAVIKFYEQIDVVEDMVEQVIKASQIDEETRLHIQDYQSELETLEREADLLLATKQWALNEIGELGDSDRLVRVKFDEEEKQDSDPISTPRQ